MAEIYCHSCHETVNDKYLTEKQVKEMHWEQKEIYICEECFNATDNPYENQPDNGAFMDNYGNFHR